MTSALKVENLSVEFDGETIIKDINLDLEKGDNMAVIGPNGAGKTVFLKALLGILPHQGKIEWAEGTKLGYVPQKIDADRHLPIDLENLLAAKADVLGVKKSEIKSVTDVTKITEKILKTPVGHLSGGQFQRALIAFALLGKPSVMLFDEPTASIDQTGEEQIYELIHELQDKYGITVILVSHDLSVVYKYATKVLCLNKTGLCFGPPESTLTPEVFKKLYGEEHKYVHHIYHK
ncbi:MAG TPA: metal ABC transporter ATP-binding protein [Candidatus Paceibacterota bacterium]|nr:metal ABC transporter ATP-binding protein [Candidatus Paceibacterota bacterium]